MKKTKIKHLANIYERYKCQSAEIPAPELGIYMADIERAYKRIPYKVVFVDVELNSFEDMCNEIETKGVLSISTLHNESAILTPEQNIKFRAVHDYLHYVLQQPFTFDGEHNVYKSQRLLHSTEIGRDILFSELVLQTAYCEVYNTFAEKQKVILTNCGKGYPSINENTYFNGRGSKI